MNETTQIKDELITKIKTDFKSGDDISIPKLQRKYLTSYTIAKLAFNSLLSDGFIYNQDNSSVSKIK
jgi:hypothetical protein